MDLPHEQINAGQQAYRAVALVLMVARKGPRKRRARAASQVGETCMPRNRSVLARMACQHPRSPQFVRIALVLGLVAYPRHQPSLRFRRNRRSPARPGRVIECCQRTIGQLTRYPALAERRVTVHSGDMGYTIGLFAGEQKCPGWALTMWRPPRAHRSERHQEHGP